MRELRSARRGDYRIVYAIVEATRRIEILHIDRRSDVYHGDRPVVPGKVM